jgi:hypothetical protein
MFYLKNSKKNETQVRENGNLIPIWQESFQNFTSSRKWLRKTPWNPFMVIETISPKPLLEEKSIINTNNRGNQFSSLFSRNTLWKCP